MKRTVCLDSGCPDWAAQPNARLLRRLTGHLAARLEEYSQEGITQVEILADGLVSAHIAGLEAPAAREALAGQRVYCQAQGRAVLFHIGAGVSFEDLDYVQAAAANLLE